MNILRPYFALFGYVGDACIDNVKIINYPGVCERAVLKKRSNLSWNILYIKHTHLNAD